jgi:hypothetical protein
MTEPDVEAMESRLRDAIEARTRGVEPRDGSAAAIEARVAAAQRTVSMRRRGLTVLGVAAGLVVIVGAIALLRDDTDQKVKTSGPAASPSTGATTPPTSGTTPAAIVTPAPATSAIWPFASSTTTFATPEDAAKSFAVDYLGMTEARLGATTGNDVEVFPNATGSARTLVHLLDDATRGWVVVGADADEIAVDTPAPHDALTSPLTVSGKSVAFEATLGVQLRPLGSKAPVFADIAMGGSSEMQPFSTTITPPSVDQPLVLVVFEGDASGRGAVTNATVIPLDAAGASKPATLVGRTEGGTLVRFDLTNNTQQPLATSDSLPTSTATLPAGVSGSLATPRGRFGTIAFFDGTSIASYNPATDATIALVTPAATLLSLDADESGRFLLWVDVNHDLWSWSGADPVKLGTGFDSAAW